LRVVDFAPRLIDDGTDTLYNFNWEVFGIRRMEVPTPDVPYNVIWPCDDCGEAWQDTLKTLPLDGSGWWWENDAAGVFDGAFYITRVRAQTDEEFPLHVEPMYTTACDTSGAPVPAEDRYLAVYVTGDERRGHAAYIGFPAYWFEHDKIKTMIRRLLTKFGEPSPNP
jgi:hypothetical protein